ncbi:hypothetical protein DUI87_16047 [Hirundo rustica rustica]|uniref:Uncharacterized protein n=1 Tax=Hirundo rustica rustica TaxID=333673 RepID=A0A3M0K038_HIRRU|nr:hypothetical protein DUI87_16047 [Hirundo rustica rustica]
MGQSPDQQAEEWLCLSWAPVFLQHSGVKGEKENMSERCHREWMLRAKPDQLQGPGEKVGMKAQVSRLASVGLDCQKDLEAEGQPGALLETSAAQHSCKIPFAGKPSAGWTCTKNEPCAKGQR